MTDKPGRILIVDDHAPNRLKLSMAVRALGNTSEVAEDGIRALEMMRAEPFDLVLLDIVMPGMSGHEVLAEMQQDEALRTLPVIVVSASDGVSTAIECIEKGAEDYLRKPFDPVLLRARIGASLTKKRLNDAVLNQMDFIRSILGKFVPDTVVTQIMESEGQLEPRRTDATVLLTDIEGFTRIVEANPPEAVVEMLNVYFRAIIKPITEHGGIVNNFDGDSLMAIFNVPVADPDHADNAVQAAMKIHAATETQDFCGCRMRTRIGIDTGEVVAGNVGDGSRLTYTVVGRAVNTAGRLEQLNKDLGSLVIVSEATASRLRRACPLESSGTVTLRGQGEPIAIRTLRPMEDWE